MDSRAKHYRYLIIGGGMTADAAVGGIRALDGAGSIGLISAEPDPPYNRPPLSKGLWTGKPLDKIWRRTEDRAVELHLGARAIRLDPEAHSVADDQGLVYTYDRLLLATGGTPRRLPFGRDDILYFRTLNDYHRLRRLADEAARIAVVGGGFIGSEVAAALAMNRRDVVMAFPEEFIGQRVFPRDLAAFVTDYFRDKGVEIHNRTAVVGLRTETAGLALQTKDERTLSAGEIHAGGVVAGLGIEPATELAQAAGLTVKGGIVVDEGLHTSHPSIFAAGDVARFYSPALDKWVRVEHEDNANTMGAMAGRAMAGESVTYHHLPYFYSDLFDLGYEAVGELDSRIETVPDWHEPYRKGVVYYVLDGRVRGVLLWNVWEQVNAARQLIAAPGPFRPQDLKGKILFG